MVRSAPQSFIPDEYVATCSLPERLKPFDIVRAAKGHLFDTARPLTQQKQGFCVRIRPDENCDGNEDHTRDRERGGAESRRVQVGQLDSDFF
jgi:hypothetical protein